VTHTVHAWVDQGCHTLQQLLTSLCLRGDTAQGAAYLSQHKKQPLLQHTKHNTTQLPNFVASTVFPPSAQPTHRCGQT
jgi:hypothetical protein